MCGLIDFLKQKDHFFDLPHRQTVIVYYKKQKQFIRDRPFNLQQGGAIGFILVQKICFHTTRELEYYFFWESDYFVFLHQNQIIFSTLGFRIIF